MQAFSFYTAIIATFIGAFLILKVFFASKDELKAAATLDSSDQAPEKSIIMRYARPIMNKYIVPAMAGVELVTYRARIKRFLWSSGMAEQYTVDQFLALKILLLVSFPFVYIFFNWAGELDLPYWAALPIAFVGFFYPDLMVSGRAKQRQNEIRIMFPFVVDLLSLSVEAGLEFFPGLQKVAEKSKKGPLIDEVNQVLKELRLGASRAEALRNFADRCDMIEVTSFVSVVITADQMGAGISNVLRQQSEQMRLERLVRAEKIAARIPAKLQIVTIFILVPVILILAIAPSFLE